MIGLRLFLLSFLLSSCAYQNNSINLKWQPTTGSIKGYRVNISDIGGFDEWIQANKQLEDIRNKISQTTSSDCGLKETDYNTIVDILEKPQEPDHWPFLANLTGNDNSTLQLKMFGAPLAAKDSIAKSDEEIMELKYRKAIEGSLQLLSDIQPNGRSQSFYLTKKQQNIVSMLFGLPDSPISAGYSWQLPVYMIELGNGFIVNQAKRNNKACLLRTESLQDGEILAHIIYTFYESVEGYYELKPNPNVQPPPYELRATYLAYGVFSVNRGNWMNYAGILEFKGSGQLPIHTSRFHLMKPFKDI
jgi:hypothetical protein